MLSAEKCVDLRIVSQKSVNLFELVSIRVSCRNAEESCVIFACCLHSLIRMDENEQSALVQKAQSGDLAAFGQLVRAHQGWLRAGLRSKLRDWTAADDLAQDSFVTAFRKIKTYRGDGSFESWINSIAQNHFRNYIRKKREDYVGGEFELEALLSEGHEEIPVAGNHTLDALRECLAQVKGPSRELLDSRYVEGKTIREISKESSHGYSSLTMKLHRLRASLADCIQLKIQAP